MAKTKVGNFVGTKSRRERREEARENKTEFIPLYNGYEPYHMNSKAVGKILKNDLKRQNKTQGATK